MRYGARLVKSRAAASAISQWLTCRLGHVENVAVEPRVVRLTLPAVETSTRSRVRDKPPVLCCRPDFQLAVCRARVLNVVNGVLFQTARYILTATGIVNQEYQ
jgi:hypothetical protein